MSIYQNKYVRCKIHDDNKGEFKGHEFHFTIMDDNNDIMKIEFYTNVYREHVVKIDYNADYIQLLEPDTKEVEFIIKYLIERYQYNGSISG